MSDDDNALDDILEEARASLENSKPSARENAELLPEQSSILDTESLSQVTYSNEPKNDLADETSYDNSRMGTLTLLFFLGLCIWFISLFSVFLSATGWITPFFPNIGDIHVLQSFLVSAILSAGTSVLLGIVILRKQAS